MSERPPRQQRSPATEADWLLARLSEMYAEAFPGKPRGYFEFKYVDRMRKSGLTGDQALEQVTQLHVDQIGMLNIVETATAFAVEAQAVHAAGDERLAWALINEAMVFYGGAMRGGEPDLKSLRSMVARDAADARNFENREHAIEVKAWCEEQIPNFASMRAGKGNLSEMARAAVAAKLNPTEYKTVRDWCSQWAVGWREKGIWPAE